jgi:hypothetical protein
MQRQRHGVAKNIAEGVGGLLVGAAGVLLLRSLLRKKSPPTTPTAPSQLPEPKREVEA